VLDIGPDDAILAFLSPAHIMQRLVVELLPAYCGIPVWFAESLLKLPQEFQRVRPTIFLAPPRLWERAHATIRTELRKRGRLVEAAFHHALEIGLDAARFRRDGRRLPLGRRILLAAADRIFFRKMRARFGGRLRVCASGSAPLGKDLAEFLLAIGFPLIEGYGLTEGGVVILNRPGHMKPGSIGQALPGVELRIAEDGELLVQSDTLFAGYYDDPAATAEVLRGGWLHTGDLAEIDSDGCVYITGRKKEVIVASSGRKIYPARIEALFRLEPIVNHVVPVGEGRPHLSALIAIDPAAAENLPGMTGWRGRPMAELAQAPPVVAAVRDAVHRVNAKLADFEQIRKYHVLDRDLTIDAGELTATLKVRRTRVIENFGQMVEG
jgi:long-chain acyl-CoA synthetase